MNISVILLTVEWLCSEPVPTRVLNPKACVVQGRSPHRVIKNIERPTSYIWQMRSRKPSVRTNSQTEKTTAIRHI